VAVICTLVMRACAGGAARQIASAVIAPQPKTGPVRVMIPLPDVVGSGDRYARAVQAVKGACVSPETKRNTAFPSV
jgi:hypothetical protein